MYLFVSRFQIFVWHIHIWIRPPEWIYHAHATSERAGTQLLSCSLAPSLSCFLIESICHITLSSLTEFTFNINHSNADYLFQEVTRVLGVCHSSFSWPFQNRRSSYNSMSAMILLFWFTVRPQTVNNQNESYIMTSSVDANASGKPK